MAVFTEEATSVLSGYAGPLARPNWTWECWCLWGEVNRKTQKNLDARWEPATNSTHTWHPVGVEPRSHCCKASAISPLRYPCSQIFVRNDLQPIQCPTLIATELHHFMMMTLRNLKRLASKKGKWVVSLWKETSVSQDFTEHIPLSRLNRLKVILK